jgi:hypothetical protein
VNYVDTLDPFDPEFIASAYERELGAKVIRGGDQKMTADGKPIAWEFMPHGQGLFLHCPYFEVLLEGNRGGGKTEVLLMDFVQHTDKGYGRYWRGLLLRKTYPELTDVIEKSMRIMPLIAPGVTYNQSTHTWQFPTGETLRFAFAEREADYWKYHGAEYPWIAWEELTTHANDKAYRKFMSLCRSPIPGMPRKYRASTNPYGVGHGWVKARFRLPGMRNRVINDDKDDNGDSLPSRIAINVRLTDNSVLLRADPDYIKKLRQSADDPGQLAAWIAGSWDIVSGGMFDDVWKPRHHVLPNFTPPSSWRIDRAYDDGSSAPFAVGWFAQSDGTDLMLPGRVMHTIPGDLFHIREWYGHNGKDGKNEGLKMDAHEITAGIIERELLWGIHGRVYDGPADSRIFSNEHGVCVADDMAQPVTINGKRYAGLNWLAADKSGGSRVAGWKQLRSLLKCSIPFDGRREKPGLFVCEGCVQWQRTVPSLPRDEKNRDDVDTTSEDHAGDMTRYRAHNPPRIVGQRAATGM